MDTEGDLYLVPSVDAGLAWLSRGTQELIMEILA